MGLILWFVVLTSFSLRYAPRNDSLAEHIFDSHYNVCIKARLVEKAVVSSIHVSMWAFWSDTQHSHAHLDVQFLDNDFVQLYRQIINQPSPVARRWKADHHITRLLISFGILFWAEFHPELKFIYFLLTAACFGKLSKWRFWLIWIFPCLERRWRRPGMGPWS